MRSTNPALNAKTFERAQAYAGEPMTLEGAVNKTAFLLFLVIAPAAWVWAKAFRAPDPATVMPYLWVGFIGGFVMALVTIFKMDWSPVTAPLYAVLEGLALGGISAFMQMRYPGIVLQAVALTFGVLLVMLVVYRSGLIQVTDRFRFAVVAATGAIALVYLVTIVLSFFGVSVPFIHQSGTIGIIFSLVVVGVAALNLVLDFDFIVQGAERGAPKFMEWYAAFGLIVTLIWLYLEILRLLSKLRRR